jgi:hypothetical protein
MSWRIVFCLLFPVSLPAQPAYFEKIYGTAGNEHSRSVKQLASGSIYVLGNSDSGTIGSNDISLSKLDNRGNVLWTDYYGTVNTENAFYLDLTSDGNFVLVAESETNPADMDIVIYKIDTTGAVIWNKSFASPVNESPRYIEQTGDGGYILCGSQSDLSGHNDILVVKLDGNGDYVWHQTFGRTDNEYSDMIHQVGTEYILTADTRSYGAGGYDVILYKLDSLGNEIWSQTYGDTLQNGCQGLLQVSDGNYLSYGETEVFPASPFDFYLEKISATGASLWRYTYGGPGTDAIFSAKEDTDGGFICTGYSNSYNGGGPLDLVILKVDRYGAFQWKQTYGGAGIDIGYEIIPSVDHNGFIITGQTFSTSEEYYLLKLDQDGLLSGISSPEDEIYMSNAFPNPAGSTVEINYKLQKNGDAVFLTVHDLSGKEAMRFELKEPEGSVKMNVSGLQPGIYFYALRTAEKNYSVKKLVILPR